MCQYIQNNTNICILTNIACPYMYYCNRKHTWLESKYKPNVCKVETQSNVPQGYCRVIQIRHGMLYVDVGGQCVRISNPFQDTPEYVKVSKSNGEWTVER